MPRCAAATESAGTGVQVPADPFTVLFGVLDGTLPWPTPAGWWLLGAVATLLVVAAVLVGIAVHRLRKGRTRVDRAAAATSRT